MNTLKPFLASIPYDIIKETENYYQTAAHLIFTMLGMNCRSEVRIAQGRIDTLVETKRFVYCFEFKLDGSAEEALAQIDTKEYLLPWKGSGKTLFKVGVVFDSEKRNIGEWKMRRDSL
ncbi:PD-(D/E)XK nuclease domain-containing protein [Breznakiellaceae bacterium SP9]